MKKRLSARICDNCGHEQVADDQTFGNPFCGWFTVSKEEVAGLKMGTRLPYDYCCLECLMASTEKMK